MNKDLALAHDFLKSKHAPIALTACSLQEALKGRLMHLDSSQGLSLLEFDPGVEFVQGGGAIQGGIVTAMLDFAMVYAAFAGLSANQSLGTATMTVNFLRPALPGKLLARGKIVKRGSRLIFAEAAIEVADAKTVAVGTSVIAVVSG